MTGAAGKFVWNALVRLPQTGPKRFAFSTDNRFLLVFDQKDNFQAWSSDSTSSPRLQPATVANIAKYLANARLFVYATPTSYQLWDCKSNRLMATTLMLNRGWVLIAPDGRFDCSSLSDVSAICFAGEG